ncbi:MAG: cell wall hydrolase [Clostridia bacterium]|nr:cell wall hydrolase [Clostridia bacterium]
MKKTIRLKNMFGFLRTSRRSRLWMLAATISALMLILPTAFQASAATVSVDVNGSALYTRQDLLKSGVTYVPLRAFADAVHDGFTISWSGLTKTATVQDGDYVLKARVGDRYILVNGERIYSTVSNLLIANRIYVPVRSVCTGMGLDVDWNGSRRLVSVSGSYVFDSDAQPDDSKPEDTKPPAQDAPDTDESGDGSIDSQDLYWLARIIHAESSGEPIAGKIAVGTVVMNRVKSSLYPDTIYDVIFDRKHGTQFTPVASGTIYNDPSKDSIEAARRVLNGERTDSRILFFVNEKLAPDNWVSKNRTYIMTIGNHNFYA